MSLITNILRNLNEAEAVKKPYGDKPEEGKISKLQRGKKASIPKNKGTGKFKVEKLNSVNAQSTKAYANDTDRYMDTVDSSEHSDKGKAATTGGKKAERTIKFPYGDKVQPSDSKLIKESAECEGCEECKETEEKPEGKTI